MDRRTAAQELGELYEERIRRQMGPSSTWNKAGSERSEERREGKEQAGAAEVAQIKIKIIQKVAECDDNPERDPLRLENTQIY